MAEPKSQENSNDIELPQILSPNEKALAAINTAIMEVRSAKPNDHSAKDRYFAIVLTKLEEAVAVYGQFIA